MLKITSPIATKRLALRPFEPDDLDDLYAIQSRADVARYLYWEARNRDQVRTTLERKVGETSWEKEGDGLVLAVTLPGAEGTSRDLIGEVGLWWRSEEHRQAEIVFAILEHEWPRSVWRRHPGGTRHAFPPPSPHR